MTGVQTCALPISVVVMALLTIVDELAQPRQQVDALPVLLKPSDVGIGGLVAASARSLATDQGRQFWVAQDAVGDLCLVVSFGKQPLVAATCARPDAVQRQGLELGFQDGSKAATVAYLLPEDADLSTVAAPWRVVTDNLVLGDRKSVV